MSCAKSWFVELIGLVPDPFYRQDLPGTSASPSKNEELNEVGEFSLFFLAR